MRQLAVRQNPEVVPLGIHVVGRIGLEREKDEELVVVVERDREPCSPADLLGAVLRDDHRLPRVAVYLLEAEDVPKIVPVAAQSAVEADEYRLQCPLPLLAEVVLRAPLRISPELLEVKPAFQESFCHLWEELCNGIGYILLIVCNNKTVRGMNIQRKVLLYSIILFTDTTLIKKNILWE